VEPQNAAFGAGHATGTADPPITKPHNAALGTGEPPGGAARVTCEPRNSALGERGTTQLSARHRKAAGWGGPRHMRAA